MVTSLAYYVTLLRKDFSGYCNQKLQELGLSHGFLFFILHVGTHPGCSPGALAEALHMDPGYVTRALTKLEQGGFIRQEKNPKDKRSRMLELEEKGAEAFRISHELFASWDAEVMKDMTEDERAQLLAVLERLAEGKGGGYCV